MNSVVRQQFGTGPLSRAAAMIYTLIVVELLLLLAMLPGLVPLFLLERHVSNLPLAMACAVPVGPALAAALYALHRRRLDLTDLHPAAAFWRGYKANLVDVLKLWVPLLVWLTIIGVNLSHPAVIPVWWRWLLVVIAGALMWWGVNALVISSLFAFRARDVARLAAYFLSRTLGNLCVLVVAAGVIAVATEAVLVLLGSVFALILLRTSHSMIERTREEFTA